MKINELGWIKKQFIEHNPDELKEGYVFTVDAEQLVFRNFQPLGWYDVEIDAFLKVLSEIKYDDIIEEMSGIRDEYCKYLG